jgi:hypothetical protein
MVEPEREIPGRTATHWMQPMYKASFQVMVLAFLERFCAKSARKRIAALKIRQMPAITGETNKGSRTDLMG